jgi:pyruvate dehydrogenase E1 component alpha subunit
VAESSATPSVGGAGGGELTSQTMESAFRTMVLARALDERALALQRQGRIGFYAPHTGQEAALVGSALALRPEDWVFPAYRELSVALVRGVPLQAIVDQLWGNARDLSKGRQMPNHLAFPDAHFVSASSPIGTQITQAVGAAMAMQRRKQSAVTITYFGDGATSSNDFHAGLNFAGVFHTPTVFFCQNNQWAISLPRSRQTSSATLAEKAEAYGFGGVVVDGNDLKAVYDAVRAARQKAAGGGGPTLIEAQVYRLGPHSTSDDPNRYRTAQEVDAAKRNDPIHRLTEELLKTKALDQAAVDRIWEDARGQIAKAIESAESAGPPAPPSIFDDVYATLTPRLEAERAELGQGPAGAEGHR